MARGMFTEADIRATAKEVGLTVPQVKMILLMWRLTYLLSPASRTAEIIRAVGDVARQTIAAAEAGCSQTS